MIYASTFLPSQVFKTTLNKLNKCLIWTYLNLRSHLKFFQQILRFKGGNTLSHEESKPITSGQGSWKWNMASSSRISTKKKKPVKTKLKQTWAHLSNLRPFGTGEQSPLPDLKSNLIIFSKHENQYVTATYIFFTSY